MKYLKTALIVSKHFRGNSLIQAGKFRILQRLEDEAPKYENVIELANVGRSSSLVRTSA